MISSLTFLDLWESGGFGEITLDSEANLHPGLSTGDKGWIGMLQILAKLFHNEKDIFRISKHIDHYHFLQCIVLGEHLELALNSLYFANKETF